MDFPEFKHQVETFEEFKEWRQYIASSIYPHMQDEAMAKAGVKPP